MNLKENISRIKQVMGILVEQSFSEQVKNEVEELFNEIPKLSSIGTPKQYYEYLNTIFPNSKVKGIFYHSSTENIEKFRDAMFGIYFSYSPMPYNYGGVVNKAILNIQNPLVIPKPEDSRETKETYLKEYRTYLNPISFSPKGEAIYKYDGSIESSSVTKEGVQVRVRNSNQIHILGNENDIIGFKNYVNEKTPTIKIGV